MSIITPNDVQDSIVQAAMKTASGGCQDINNVLTDIQGDSKINDTTALNASTGVGGGIPTAANYGVAISSSLDISTAAGAMVIDDLMQKISTKVQVASQMLAAANNINKTAGRVLSQG